MNRILVPIDFTKVSDAAYHYAFHLSIALKAEITVIHVINGGFSTVDASFMDTMDIVYESANQKLADFINEFAEKTGNVDLDSMVKREVRFGVPGFTIADFANDQKFDYVVAGMRDNHNVIERVLGTTSTIITKMASCPVILIHENTNWIAPKKIIFTLDNSADFDESISKFIRFNSEFKASTDFIHIRQDEEVNLQHTKDAVIKEIFESEVPDFSFEIKTIYGGDIVQSIVDYSIFEKADMLVMVHRKRSLLDSFFNRSLCIKTAEGFHLPIMVLEENLIRKL
ncbi:MAG: universal stress protein [Saprospiraceae bacterium]|nr:universal stress protein [Saprospiraceae bacterium]